MSKLIRTINKYDPSFRKKLDEHYRKCCPRLAEAEREFIPHLIFGVPLKKLSWEECMQIICASLETTPFFEITMGFPPPQEPNWHLRWEAREIARDRFGYLLALMDHLPSSCGDILLR